MRTATLALLPLPTLALAGPERNDIIALEQDRGSVLLVDRVSGTLERVLSGADLVTNGPGVASPDDVGAGAEFGALATGSMVSPPYGREVFIAALRSGPTGFEPVRLYAIDVFTGERRVLNDTELELGPFDARVWSNGFPSIQLDSAGDLVVANGNANGTRVFRFDPRTGNAQLLGDTRVGDGFRIEDPRDALLVDDDTLLVTAGRFNGAFTFRVDLTTGDRELIGWHDQSLDVTLREWENGEQIMPVRLNVTDVPGRGAVGGSSGNLYIGSLDGEVYVGHVGQYPGGPNDFEGCLVRFDPATGRRDLVLGTAYRSIGRVAVGPVSRMPPANDAGFRFENADTVIGGPDGRLWFNDRFGSDALFAFDVVSREVEAVAELHSQLASGWVFGAFDPEAGLRIRDFVFYNGTVCSGDFDGDGSVDLGDFGAFGASFGAVSGETGFDTRADLDRDGDIDLGDFGAFGVQFGRTDCLE